MFIILKHINDIKKLRINVSSIVAYYEYQGNGTLMPNTCTQIITNDGKYFYVMDTPEEIDTLIEEALEQRVTSVDNLLGLSYLTMQYGRC